VKNAALSIARPTGARLTAMALVLATWLSMSPLAGASPIEVTGAWSRATAPGAQVGAAYLTLDTDGHADRLISIESAVAERVEIHEMRHEDGVMKMRRLGPPLVLEADTPLVLEPGGLHLMLIGLKQPLVAGEHYRLTFEFEHSDPVAVDVEVRSATTQ
jgi:copper(I)-binding protein